MQLPVLLDRSRTEPLATQLADQLREAVRRAHIAPGARLPSSRRLAEQLEVARNTVVRAYDVLLTEGYVEARPASGIFAASQTPDVLIRPAAGPAGRPAPAAAPEAIAPGTMPAPVRQARSPVFPPPTRNRPSFDFAPGAASPGVFPLKTWRRLLQSSLSHGGAVGLAQCGDPAGLPLLRGAIASHLAATRGIVADVGQVIITAGVQQGLCIAARLFLAPGRPAAIEDPGSSRALFAFEAEGAQIASVPVDEDGLRPDGLPPRAALLHLTPSHQYPTGHVLAASRRPEIIAWARRAGCHIIEDDRDSDFRYEGSPLPALAAAAPDCVIYLGSFARSLGSGLRIGYMVVPRALVQPAARMKALLDGGTPWLDQAVLAEFLRNGSYAAHLLRIRAHYRENRDRLLAALRRQFGPVDVSGEGAGSHMLWRLPPGVPDAAVLEALAHRARVGVYAFPGAGVHAAGCAVLAQRGIVLGYAALSPRQIDQGIARLSDAVDDALDFGEASVDELFARAGAPVSSARRPHLASPRLDSSVNRQPALRAHPPARAASAPQPRGGDAAMPVLSAIYRYPIKGLSAQPMADVLLEAGQPFPRDRVFALVRPGAPIDPDRPRWAKKGLFVMLMLDEALASVRTWLDPETQHFTAMRDGQTVLAVDLGQEEGRAAFERFIADLVPTLREPPRLVRSRDGHFMDKPDSVMSLINLATLRRLEEQWGVKLDPLRFRANFYIDGAEPWEEFDWIGGDVRIGDATFRVDRRNGRCGAVNVNPANGRRDMDIPGSLRALFGHKDLGVYLVARKGGRVAVGDDLVRPGRPAMAAQPPGAAPAAEPRPRQFICRGCYYIYDEAQGVPAQSVPPGTPFAELTAAWRCPDCGTDKTTFRPHVAARAMVAGA